MSFKSFALAAALVAMTLTQAIAQPSLVFTNPGDGTFKIQVMPDATQLGTGAAFAVELAVQLTGGATLQTAAVGLANGDGTLFDTANPGDNPFVAGTVIPGGDSTGLVDATGSTIEAGDNDIFIAYGSNVATTGTLIDLLDLTFTGSGTITIAPDLSPELGGDVLAQGGTFADTVTIAETSFSITDGGGPSIDGDFDGDGDVDGVDLGVFAFDFANSPEGGPPFAQSDFDEDGDVDGVDLGVFSFNFANFPPTSTAIPEPTALGLLALAAAGFSFRRNG